MKISTLQSYNVGWRCLILLFAVALLASCGTINRFFSPETEYEQSAEARPLEVPPDLDAPDRSGALRIPGETDDDQRLTVETPPLASGERVRLDADGRFPVLLVDDSVESTWRRAGFALERAGIDIVQRDAERTLYQISYVDPNAQPPRQGFFKRLFTWGDPEVEPQNLTVSVEGAGDDSRVTVLHPSGDYVEGPLAQPLLELLADRLG